LFNCLVVRLVTTIATTEIATASISIATAASSSSTTTAATTLATSPSTTTTNMNYFRSRFQRETSSYGMDSESFLRDFKRRKNEEARQVLNLQLLL